ncbi:MAG: D-alanyl-D-alanine carboxypeptidase [Oscillibacter sp.]|nr:D-alanyl-D-alanine carboxypeptidase [Oscillibacter sp.]
MDVDSGRVLYEQNADAKMLIASTTKIMTALVAVRDGKLSDTVTVSREAAYTEGSSMYLKEGEELTLETLLYGLMLCSGNDAAVAVAEHVGGSVQGFVKRMNETAGDLGMDHSSFANPNGLDDEKHYSTARDMAVLACAALENETVLRIASTRSITIGGRTMTNHNKLLSMMDGCLGLKTGYTRAAGRTLVSCAERNGQRLVAVTLQDGNDWADHQSLFEYGFSAYPARRPAVLGRELGRAAVAGGMSDSVPLVAADSFSWPLAEGEQLETSLELFRDLSAPVTAGTRAGQAVFTLNGQEVGRVDLLCGETVLPVVASAMGVLRGFR